MSDTPTTLATDELKALAAELRDVVPQIDAYKEMLKPLTTRETELRAKLHFILTEGSLTGFRGAEGIQLTIRNTKQFQIVDEPALLRHLHSMGKLGDVLTLTMVSKVDTKAVEMIEDSIGGTLDGTAHANNQSLVVKIADKIKDEIRDRTVARLRGDHNERDDAAEADADPLMSLLNELEAKPQPAAQLDMLAAPTTAEPSLPDSEGHFTVPAPTTFKVMPTQRAIDEIGASPDTVIVRNGEEVGRIPSPTPTAPAPPEPEDDLPF